MTTKRIFERKPNLLLNNWLSAASQRKITLLRDDREFVLSLLPKIPYDRRREVLQTYLDTWSRFAGECEDPIAADNMGRRAANKYIMEICGC